MQIKSLEDTYALSDRFSRIIGKDDVIFLYGEIGVGKTTFIRFLVNCMEKRNSLPISQILSPTFNIVYDYDILDLKILHYDLYRLKNSEDLEQLGIFENKSKNLIIIEWPELIKTKPKDRIEIYFRYLKEKQNRNIRFLGFGKWKKYKFHEI